MSRLTFHLQFLIASVFLVAFPLGAAEYAGKVVGVSGCEEARFYLTRCGLKTLDGNRDGEPCEALCATSRR